MSDPKKMGPLTHTFLFLFRIILCIEGSLDTMKRKILFLIALVTILSGCSFGIGSKKGDMDLFLTTASIADDASPSSMGPVLLADDEVEDHLHMCGLILFKSM